MGLSRQEIIERNKKIINDHNDKVRVKDIARKYDLTRARVYQILNNAT